MRQKKEPLDHAQTYLGWKFRNIPHQLRLKRILGMLARVDLKGKAWADVGCSNGFMLSKGLEFVSPCEAFGFDYSEDHLQVARQRVPQAIFAAIDLNQVCEPHRKFDLVTCFETLEHVGNLQNAMATLLAMGNSGGRVIITVPIEIGLVGTIKYLVKRIVYNYRLSELPDGGGKRGSYLGALLSGRRITLFRSEKRSGWGTHFGFDLREVDDILTGIGASYTAHNHFSTRFYEIRVG